MRTGILPFVLAISIMLVDSCVEKATVENSVYIEEAGSNGPEAAKTYQRIDNLTTKKDSIKIKLIGPPRSVETKVGFAIDPASTAVEGTHYRLIPGGRSITIPANKNEAYIRFDVIAGHMLSSETFKLKFALTSADVKIGSFKEFTRTIKVFCEFNRANFLGAYYWITPGYTYDQQVITAGSGANEIIIDNFWDYGGVVKYVFNPDASTPIVTLPSQDVVMGGVTFVVSGTNVPGSYDPCLYSFVVPYTVRRKSDNVLMDNAAYPFVKKQN